MTTASPLPPNVTAINPQAAAQAAAAAAANAAAWGTTGNAYDPDRFYCAAKDGPNSSNPGAYEHARFKVPTWIAQTMRVLIDSRDVPNYSTPDDIVRDALYHRFTYLQGRRGNIDFDRKVAHFRQQIEHEQGVVAAEVELAKILDLTARAEAMFAQYAEQEMWASLRQQIEHHRDHIDAWENGKPRNHLLALCNQYEDMIPADFMG